MATIRQIEANRLNAQKSTGPKTEEGKARTRRNALKHGLSGEGIVLPAEEAEAVNERLSEWLSSLKPCNPFEMWLAEQVAIESVRVDTCQRQQIVLRGLQVHRAHTSWDDDRRLEAEELALRLAKAPGVVSRQLRTTPQGCECLLDRWRLLEQILLEEGGWDHAQRGLAFDMLGLPPELRGRSALNSRGPDARERCLEVVRREVESLTRQRDALRGDHDDLERSAAELGLAAQPSKALELARRYLAQCLRRLQWAWSQFKKGRHDVNPDSPPPSFDFSRHRALEPREGDVAEPRNEDRSQAEAVADADAETDIPAGGDDSQADEAASPGDEAVTPASDASAGAAPPEPPKAGATQAQPKAKASGGNRRARRARRSEERRKKSA